MKKRKILSLLLSLCLLISLLPTVALAADQEASAAGVQITEESYDSVTSILTVNVQIKMPDNSGINTVGSLISYDSSKLTLMDASSNTLYTATSSQTKATSAVIGLLACEETTTIPGIGTFNTPYTVVNADLYGVGSRAGLFVGMSVYPGNTPKTSQKTTDWLTIYQLRFKVTGDPTAVLNSDSLRIADPAKDNDVIKGAYAANDYYTVSVNSYSNKYFKYGKMAANSESDLTGDHWAIPAANVTATYPGSTNPVTPPATYTVSFNANGGSGSMADVTGVSGEYTLPANGFTAPAGKQFKAWSVGGVEKAVGDKITVTANTTVTAVWEDIPVVTYTVSFDNNGGTGSMADVTGVSGEYTLPANGFTAPAGKQFKAWSVGGVEKAAGDTITVNANTTVTAIWEPISVTEYTINFDVNGGSGTIPPQTTSGKKLSSLPTAAHSGSYSFDGWYTAASGGTQITTAYVFSANTTVYAHWTYTGGGGSYYAPVVPDMPMLYRGCTGDAVKTLQEKLNAKGFDSGNVDGIFGAKTYAAATAFQKANGLGVDGIVGKLTWAKLYDATPVNVTPVTTQPMLRTGSRGDAVRKLQELLNAKGYTCGNVDGIFGSKTYAAVLAFQKANGLAADGIVGSLTWGKLV